MDYFAFNYKYDFLAFIRDYKIIKIVPYFGKWKEKLKNQNLKIKKINFEDLKKFEISFEIYSPIYKKLHEILKEKRLYTYSEVAEYLNINPYLVGKILNRNPFLILIPCHRVISKKGIGGYVLGKEIKEELLKFEGLLR